MTKFILPILILAMLCRMGIALADTQRCRVSNDCKYSDETCVYRDSEESEGHVGECLRPGADLEAEIQYDQTGPEYKHGDHCIDGRVF